jgi:hypothetical protein
MDGKRRVSSLRKKIGIWLLTFVLIILMIPLLIIFLISDSEPLVRQTAEFETESAFKAKQIAKNLYTNLTNGKEAKIHTLTLTAKDINGVIALGIRGVPRLSGRVNVSSLGIITAFTMRAEENPFGRFVNLKVTIIPSSNRLVVSEVSLGTLNIPGGLALATVKVALDYLFRTESIGTKLIDAVESIHVENTSLTLSYRSVPALKVAIESAKTQFKNLRDDLELVVDPDLVKLHYEHLCKFHSKISGIGRASLGYYLSTAFKFAEKRSFTSKLPIEENKATLLALSILLGTSSFNAIIGALDSETLARCQPDNSQVVLANRNDLRLHFIFSAALKIISDSGVSFAIGEFKEFLD